MARCIFCENELTSETAPEHVLLNALGGRMTTRNAICTQHNNIFGSTIDKALAGQLDVVRNYLQLRSGTRKAPPALKNVAAGSEIISISSDGKPHLEVPPFTTVDLPDGRVEVSLMVTEDRLHEVLPHLAAKLKIPLDELKKQIMTGPAAIIERRPQTIGHQLSFGGADALRSITKSCLVLLATRVGSDLLKGSAYEAAREFVLDGSDNFNKSQCYMDPRELPCANGLMAQYDDLFNLIYVKSDGGGRTIGHFTLYNMVSWQVVLAEDAGVREAEIALISDPLSGKWSSHLAESYSVDFTWLNTLHKGDVTARGRTRMEAIADRYFANGHEQEINRIVDDVCQKHGFLNDDDPIPAHKLNEIKMEISARIAAHAAGAPFEDKLTPERLRKLLRLPDAT